MVSHIPAVGTKACFFSAGEAGAETEKLNHGPTYHSMAAFRDADKHGWRSGDMEGANRDK